MNTFTKNVSEKQLEQKFRKEIITLKGLCIKFKAPAFNGVPDRIIMLPGGKLYFIELKKPKQGVLSPVQLTVHKIFGKLGFKVITIFTFDDLEKFIYNVSL